MTRLREKILYFFDNVSKKEYKFKELEPSLYEKFKTITKNYPDKKYFRLIQNIRNKHHYILYILSDRKNLRMFSEYCKKHKIPMSSSILKYYNIELTMVEFYNIIHGNFPKCKFCNNNLPSLKVQLYSPPEVNSDRFCSTECQKAAHISKVKNVLDNNNSDLIKYDTKISSIRCSECDDIFERNTSNIFSKNMYKCNICLSKYTKGQLEIYSILKEIDNDVQLEFRNVLDRKILDIYSEKFKIAVEFDGLMYHSYGTSSASIFNNINIDKHVHSRRMIELNKLGIRLFRIWDIEWLNPISKDKWKNILLNAFKINPDRIYARKCNINIVNSKDARLFLDSNHMQGYAPAQLYYGLYYNNMLVSLMSFGKSIRSKGEWELLRFCSLKNTTVIGAASKLLKHFENTIAPSSLISYANLRWSEGKIYELLGFKCDRLINPSYYYFMSNYDKTLKIYHRTKFTRSNIKKYYENRTYEIYNFNDNLTEFENMFNNKYRIIYDCGMKKYIKRYQA